jgi:hypothetical protein
VTPANEAPRQVWKADIPWGRLNLVTSGRSAIHPPRKGGNHSVACALAAFVIAGLAVAQEGPGYAPAENPFQVDYAFRLGEPITLRVQVLGVRLDTFTLTTQQDVREGETVKCQAQLVGSSVAEKKATLTVVLLLEDADGQGLGRVTLEPFKAKPAKAFDEKQRVTVGRSALVGAVRAYLFVQVAF